MGKTVRHIAVTKEKDRKSKEKSKKKERVDKFYNTYEERQFQQHLREINLQYIEMKGDGNCMFRSIAHQLGREPIEQHHIPVREEVVDYMEKNKDMFMMFIDVDDVEDITDEVFADYIDRMKGFGEWGGHPELYAAAQYFQVDIIVHQWDAPKYVISGSSSNPPRVITLSYHGDCHYNSIVPIDPSQIAPQISQQHLPSIDGEFKESIKRAVPWASDKDIAIAKRELSASNENEGEQRNAISKSTHVDDIIDFLCANMEAIRLGHFEDQDQQTNGINTQEPPESQKDGENGTDSNLTQDGSNKQENEWTVSTTKSKRKEKTKVLSKKVRMSKI